MNNTALNTRVWVYQANRLLSLEEQAKLKPELDAFVAQWAAHGTTLKASAHIVHDCLLVFTVDQSHEPASGCSIDSSVKFVKELGIKFDFNAFDRNTIAFLKDDQISFTSLAEINKAKGGKVFNLSVSNLEEYRNKFILDFEDSALAKVAIDSSFKLSL